MKRIALYIGITAGIASCSIQGEDFQKPVQDDVVFYATFEQPAEDGTKVYSNEDLLLRWTSDDRVSIFNKVTYNQEYIFTGETGDNGGTFSKVGDEFATGNAISHIVSVYPYQKSTKISENENLTIELPTEQLYADNTFGLGANTMVSVTSDNLLQYKNVGGYLILKLYGEGVSVSSITLKGNNGEKLAGKATVSMPVNGVPTTTMTNDATSEIMLTCATPVRLGSDAKNSTQFWFVVPPVTFSKGFQITVSGNGGVFEKSTEKIVTIERNNLSKMSSIEVDISHLKNVIHYTSSDGSVVTPYNSDAFGACILSNEYADGQGIITFDGDVASIGDHAFWGCESLSSITIPDGVTSIGDSAFAGCTSLTNITIPDSVTSLGGRVFQDCIRLTSITIKSKTPPTGYVEMLVRTNNAPIYVPAESVEAYKSAQYWSDYADRIQAIPSTVPEAIDLGLSVKWASFNLGASKPEEFGDYYAWGETEPYYRSQDPLTWKEGKEEGYNDASYRWYIREGVRYSLTKYCGNAIYGYLGFQDDKFTLDMEDDAAHVILGGKWRMPTYDELNVLWTQCSWERTSINGVFGNMITGPNGNSIFIPAAGVFSDKYRRYVGSDGYYWSSSLYHMGNSSRLSWLLHFSKEGRGEETNKRSWGLCIRPVCD